MRWLKEPLLHFLLIGAGLFLLYGLQVDDTAGQPDRIVLSGNDVDRIINLWERKWQRLPSQQELQGLIEQQIREEVLYREALAMGLDTDDIMVRRRMAQKMEFISNDLASLAEPDDADLADYLATHADRFQVPGRISFTQVYLNTDQRGKHVREDAQTLLAELAQSTVITDITVVGDLFMGGYSHDDVTDHAVAGLFGNAFAQQIFELPVGTWTGPVKSGFGLHLVRIDARTDSRTPALEQVRDRVRDEWRVEQRRMANDALYAELRKRYEIVIEHPAPRPLQTASSE